MWPQRDAALALLVYWIPMVALFRWLFATRSSAPPSPTTNWVSSAARRQLETTQRNSCWTGLSLSSSDDGVVLRSNFNALAGPGFTAVKALELFNAVSALTAVVVVAGDVDEFRSKYERLMRIVVREASSPLLVTLGGAVNASVASDVQRELLQLHRDESGDEASPLEVVVVRADSDDDAAIVQTLRSVTRRPVALSAAELSQKWALASKRATSRLDKVRAAACRPPVSCSAR